MKRIAVFSFRDILRWAMVPGVVALAAIGNPTIAQGEPINSCFGEVLDYAEASQMPGDLAVLQNKCFQWQAMPVHKASATTAFRVPLCVKLSPN